jgi:2-dehydro-3-deoxygluconokinase
MGPDLARLPMLCQARVVHLSGITAALSGSCTELLTEIVRGRTEPGPVVSFDVNYRPALWRRQSAGAGQVLLELASHAGLVFVGRDEAEAVWGTRKVEEIRDLIGPGPAVVVKDAGHGATAYVGEEEVFVPAPACPVLERVGAGDAFAAGYLAALLEGRGPATGLRLGHLVAAATLSTRHDVPAVPPREVLEPRLALDDAAWSALRLP